MTLWICIGVYVAGMAVAPCILSFLEGQQWATRDMTVGDDIGISVTVRIAGI